MLIRIEEFRKFLICLNFRIQLGFCRPFHVCLQLICVNIFKPFVPKIAGNVELDQPVVIQLFKSSDEADSKNADQDLPNGGRRSFSSLQPGSQWNLRHISIIR